MVLWYVLPIDFQGRSMSPVKRLPVKTWPEDEGLGVRGESETGLQGRRQLKTVREKTT